MEVFAIGVIALISLLAGGFFFLAGARAAASVSSFLSRSTLTTGVVVGQVEVESPPGTMRRFFAPVVEFRNADGHAIRFNSSSARAVKSPYAKGATVPVRYDPLQPAIAEIAAGLPTWGYPIGLMFLGLMFLAATGIVVWWGLRPRLI